MSEEIKVSDMWTREKLLEMWEDSGKAIEKLGGWLEHGRAEIAALRAECARKDSALENSYRLVEEAFYDGFSCAVCGNGDANARELWPHSLSKSDLEIARAALTPSDAGKRYAAMARVCEAAEEVSDSRTRTRQFDGSPGVVDEMHLRMKLDALDEALRAMEGA